MTKARDLADFLGSGADIAGTITADGLTVDGAAVLSGRVGIATSSPNTALDVVGAVTARGDGNSVAIYASSGAALRQTGAAGGAWYFDVGTGGATHGQFIFRSSSSYAERMRLDSSGNLLLGTTTSGGTGGISFRLGSAGTINALFNRASTTATSFPLEFQNGGTGVGNIAYNNTGTSYNTSSDYRLKEDVQPMVGASDRVLSLNPVNFAWKADGSRTDGFIAHEVQEVAPYAVTGEKDGKDMQAMDHSKLVPLLTAALQEALGRITALEAEVASLKA